MKIKEENNSHNLELANWNKPILYSSCKLQLSPEEVGSVVRSRGCSACCSRRVYWNVNYFAMARAVVGHRGGNALYRLHAGRRQSMAIGTSSQ